MEPSSIPVPWERLRGRRIAVIVAHQDDESLYFGGLLSLLAGDSRLDLISTTAPMEGRPDTAHRMTAFLRVASLLRARSAACLGLPDSGPRGASYPVERLTADITRRLGELSGDFDVALTHGLPGEPNAVYGSEGHGAHRATAAAVRAIEGLEAIGCGIGVPGPGFVVDYPRDAKRALLDCYAPYWTPVDYPFAWDAERFVIG